MDRLAKSFERNVSCRSSQVCAAAACWLLAASAALAQQFPYTAYVTGDQAYVRSGPSQRYYPTGQVPQGYAVEVYRHDGEGWCAIRPPAGSFSWIASHQVRPVEAGVVEIVEQNVVTRVGSTLSPDRSAVQVLLPRGERLELMPAGMNDDPRWVRVAAPAGEFRWIAASELSLQPPMEVAPPQPVGGGWTQQSPHSQVANTDEPNAFGHLDQAISSSTAGLQFGKPNHLQTPAELPVSQASVTGMDVVAGSPAELQLAQFQSQPTPGSIGSTASAALDSTSIRPRVRFEGMPTLGYSTVGSVEELELRISQAVVQPPQHWELDPLEAAANSLLESTNEPPVRAQLREVLQRITRFQEVQQRYLNPSAPLPIERDPFEPTTVVAAPTSEAEGLTGLSKSVRERVREDLAEPTPTRSHGTPVAVSAPRYDAAGVLKPVVSKRPQAPQYALVDDQGKVVSFVTPTPDLNLQPYVGRRIGVSGTRGFMPEYRRAHVTAGRVTPIDGTVRR